MSSGWSIQDANVQNLFKKKYAKYSRNMYNGKNEFLGRVKKSYDVVGSSVDRALPLGFQGGAGGNADGTLPTANRAKYGLATFQTVSLFVTAEVDRRSMALAKDGGAFVEGMKETVAKTTEKYNWLTSFCMFNTGGKAGIVQTVTDNGAGNYDVVITAASYKRANWEVFDHVNFGDGNFDRFEILSHTPSTRTVNVTRRSGSAVPAISDNVYLQGLYGASPISLKEVCDASSSTLYGQSVAYRWQAYQYAAASAGISVDLMNTAMLGVHEQCGESPNLIMVGYTQMIKLLSLLEDQKRYFREGQTMKSRYGDFSFSTVEFMSIDKGPIPIIVDRFIEDDRMYFVNDNFVEICHTANSPGWADDEGFVFLRKPGTDKYDARYASYLQNYIPPTMHGVITGLAT